MSSTASQPDRDDVIVATARAHAPDLGADYRNGTAGGLYERPGSDLDVALRAEKRLAFTILRLIAVDLMRRFGRDVDVVDLRAVPVTLRARVAAEGTRLFAADGNKAAGYESRAFPTTPASTKNGGPFWTTSAGGAASMDDVLLGKAVIGVVMPLVGSKRFSRKAHEYKS